MTIGYEGISRVVVPWHCISEAHEHLQAVGRYGAEGFALWAGVELGDTFWVKQTCIPEQRALHVQSGLCVTVAATELHRINVWLYQVGYQLIAQLHSHPTEAYHSDTDDAYPIVATVGTFSIVIPDYARFPFSWNTAAVYRLTATRGWSALDLLQVRQIFHIED